MNVANKENRNLFLAFLEPIPDIDDEDDDIRENDDSKKDEAKCPASPFNGHERSKDTGTDEEEDEGEIDQPLYKSLLFLIFHDQR